MVAQHNLGNCYYKGDGVEQNYEEAVKWYRNAAKQGDSYAQFFFKYFCNENCTQYEERIKTSFISSLDCQLCTAALQEIIAQYQENEIYENINILYPNILDI